MSLLFSPYTVDMGRVRYSAKAADGVWYEIAGPDEEFRHWVWWRLFGPQATADSLEQAIAAAQAHDRARRGVK